MCFALLRPSALQAESTQWKSRAWLRKSALRNALTRRRSQPNPNRPAHRWGPISLPDQWAVDPGTLFSPLQRINDHDGVGWHGGPRRRVHVSPRSRCRKGNAACQKYIHLREGPLWALGGRGGDYTPLDVTARGSWESVRARGGATSGDAGGRVARDPFLPLNRLAAGLKFPNPGEASEANPVGTQKKAALSL
ncbi:hypothetical protein SKAU_G00111660 [Synaphobranchus kaupii]|uniref:Uncharacterized protein n=1 Tax=Synaphobranchus kaupii TaxID=118154 RepID=A0A9Q1G0D8_SYNKA|nr:hypothetical protein SKAU_G00111660 [Synaphobranchus kaupii]